MENLLLKSAALVVALAVSNEADAQKAPVAKPVEKAKVDVKASPAAKEQLKTKTAAGAAGKGDIHVKDGWFKVGKPADKSTPVEKVDVKKAASKVKN
jgi:hypothetical protein